MAREAELADLLRWALSERRSDLRLLLGPAGCGKSWLAEQLATALREQGWAVADGVRHEAAADVLVVLDHAMEVEPAAIRAALAEGQGRRRLLLLERDVDPPCPWWRDVGWPLPPVRLTPSANAAAPTTVEPLPDDLYALCRHAEDSATLLDTRAADRLAELAAAGLADDHTSARVLLHRLRGCPGTLPVLDALLARHDDLELVSQVQSARASALGSLERHHQAIAAAEAALAGHRQLGDRLAQCLDLCLRAHSLHRLGRLAEAHADLDAAVRVIGDGAAEGDPAMALALAAALGSLAEAHLWRDDADEADRAAQESLVQAQRAADSWLAGGRGGLALAHERLAAMAGSQGRPGRQLREARLAEQGLTSAGDRGLLSATKRQAADALHGLGRHAQAFIAADEAVTAARAHLLEVDPSGALLLAEALHSRAQCRVWLDQWDDSLADIQEALALCLPRAADQPGGYGAVAVSVLISRAWWLTRLDPRHAETAAMDAVDLAGAPGLVELRMLPGALTERAAICQGLVPRRRLAAAQAEAVAAWRAAAESGSPRARSGLIAALIAQADGLAHGWRRGPALGVAREALALARASDKQTAPSYWLPTALLTVAKLALRRLHRVESRTLLHELVSCYRASQLEQPQGWVLEQASAAVGAARLLRAVREPELAAEALALAVDRLRQTPFAASDLRTALTELDAQLRDLGRYEEAEACRREIEQLDAAASA